ncbi:hypothetical protein DFH08DRAFT_1087415 [Mycena albidolilacea]|uniref:Uncharacterized protein n=1 Tax=Mycena albidolilacea TaxID=1033008 RepID=A0AAD6ZAB7_9AGAR|nr:hypothetical protein DFH08DRAFT_1087415 [Mycena albidolilacea]
MYSLNLSHLNLPTLRFIPTQSKIHTRRLVIIDRHGEERSRAALCEIIGSLTLPCLRELLFRSSSPHDTPLFWPRNSFPAFAARPAFGRTLTKLFLYHMVITEDELVECLSEMSLLQELFIQDNTKASGLECENPILLTNSLFRRLAWRPDSSLAPDLKKFAFASLLFFDEHALIQFVDSRLVPGATPDGPFKIEEISLIDSELEPGIVGNALGVLAIARMTTLQKEGQLCWSRHPSKFLEQKFPDVVGGLSPPLYPYAAIDSGF